MGFDLVIIPILFTVLVNLVAVNSAQSYANVSKSFKESCDEASNIFCDISVGLICSSSKKCACIDDVSIFFELQTRSCVRLANSTCGELTEVGDNVNIPCTAGAECVITSAQSPSLSRTCKCSEGYTTDNNGKCSAISQETPSCSTSKDCGPGMTCIRNRCVCVDQEDMIYDEMSQSCKSLVDTACFINPIGGVIKDCVDNAECIAENPMVGYCKCRLGFDPDGNKLCVWDGVSPTEPPPSTLSTTRRTTTTTTEMTTTLSTTIGTRTTTLSPGLAVIGQPCESEIEIVENGFVGTKRCILNAFCSMGKCVCIKGYVPENVRKCAPAGGTSLIISTPLLIICVKIALNILNVS